jgi:TolA-binding protein
MQLQQQLQTSEELVQELKSRLEKQETAMRDLQSDNRSLTSSANEAKVWYIDALPLFLMNPASCVDRVSYFSKFPFPTPPHASHKSTCTFVIDD